MLDMKVRRYKLWWSENGDGVGGVGVMVKGELCEKVVEVRRVSDSDDNLFIYVIQKHHILSFTIFVIQIL